MLAFAYATANERARMTPFRMRASNRTINFVEHAVSMFPSRLVSRTISARFPERPIEASTKSGPQFECR